MKVIPSIDLLGGKVVRLLHGDFDKVTKYYDDPLEAALMLASKGAKRIHIVDLDAAKGDSGENLVAIEKLIKSDLHDLDIQVGGGIRSIQDVENLIELGVKKVIIGSLVFTNPNMFSEIVKSYGQKIIVALDVKDGFIMTNGWKVDTGTRIEELLKSNDLKNVYGIMVTDIAVDGALTGPNIDLMKQLNQFTHYRWIASGGVKSKDDLEKLKRVGVYGAILGKAIYEGLIDDLRDL